MEYDTIKSEIDAFCKKTGLSASTVCVRALGNSRFLERHERKVKKIDYDIEVLRKFMARNSTPSSENGAAQ